MKVLFVASGNSKDFEIAPFIKEQSESIYKLGIEIDYFQVVGKGIAGYVRSAKRLRKYLLSNPVDIIHAHYTLCGWSAVFARYGIPVVLSIMGDDAYGSYISPNKVQISSKYLTILTLLIQPFINAIISKSNNIDKYVWRKKSAFVIPNGVSIDNPQFFFSKKMPGLGTKKDKKYVLFLGDKTDIRKNYKLIEDAVNLLKDDRIELIAPYPISHEEVFSYLNITDVFTLASFNEGSPNVVKEAMICNCPIVSTDVGDVNWLFGDTPGHFLTRFDPVDVAEKIKLAIDFREKYGKTKGRERIIELGLDSETVARKIIEVYKKVLKITD